ncbi:hypothetical protein EAL2_c19700 [Peptoclostridium acidaminophilum DSM 3953]|uniref:Uncharacterized protein n=1 Tax=Peptoclostridium acidaminophilum DSM 3953 TaxID=1286171 RepID=W8U8R8_PEPAC|nr:hypothetical protein EAL2_c19700 [Peptoclostridium acidaminophilum DSM 3953]
MNLSAQKMFEISLKIEVGIHLRSISLFCFRMEHLMSIARRTKNYLFP